MIAVSLGFVIAVVLILLGAPIAYVLVVGLGSFLFLEGQFSVLPLLNHRIGSTLNSFTFIAVPLFLLAGHLLTATGMSARLMRFALAFMGRSRGGLPKAGVISDLVMAGMSGSATADTAATGAIFIPLLKKAGYSSGYSAAVTAVPSMVGAIIPPSIIAVIYAGMTTVSVGAILLAGVGPGLLLAFGLFFMVWVMSFTQDVPRGERASLREIRRHSVDAIWALFMPVVILGGLFSGVYTATEGAALAVAYALFVGFVVYRSLTMQAIWTALVQTLVTNGAVMFVVGIAAAVSWVMTREGAVIKLASGMTPFLDSPIILWSTVILGVFILGTFLESASLLVLVTPILVPPLLLTGADPLVIGMIIILAAMVGAVTPPIGLSMFIVIQIADCDIREYSRNVWPFLIVVFAVFALLLVFPWIVTAVPSWTAG